jgi:hypothetical protein
MGVGQKQISEILRFQGFTGFKVSQVKDKCKGNSRAIATKRDGGILEGVEWRAGGIGIARRWLRSR